jgi:spore germination cell wall hydrolase CwlJ-like protein
MQDIDTLARTLWGEARGEGELGIRAIACVIKNRFNERKWYSFLNGTHTIAGVCKKPWQFSCWNKSDPNYKKMLSVTLENDPAFKVCWQAAGEAVDGYIDDITFGANHYFATWIKRPKWAENMKFCCSIGQHNFYKG